MMKLRAWEYFDSFSTEGLIGQKAVHRKPLIPTFRNCNKVFRIVVVCLFILLVLLYLLRSSSSNNLYKLLSNKFQIKEYIDRSNESCTLRKRNPWEESIIPVFDPLFGYQSQCNKTNLRTKLDGGMLRTIEKNDNCWGRCLNYLSYERYTSEDWQNGSYIFKCDIVEVKCSRTDNIKEYDYIWIHTQIHENEEVKKTVAPVVNDTYDVFLLVLDSTSHTQSNRNLAKTLKYLKNALNGVEFPFLNRVAKNSWSKAVSRFVSKHRYVQISWIYLLGPYILSRKFVLFEASATTTANDYSNQLNFVLSGEISEKVNRDLVDTFSIEPTTPEEDQLNLTSTIQRDFEKNGYVIYMFEDSLGTNNVIGWSGTMAPHNNNAFRSFWKQTSDEKLNKVKMNNSCTDKREIMYNHASQFLNSYKDLPKFTTVWDTDSGHDDLSSSIVLDTILYDFFIKHRKHLEKSFIIVTGDHGLRIQKGKTSPLGRFEINNPMLVVVPPKQLASNRKLMETLRENSQKLQTHHDTRETLLDILKYQPISTYLDREPLNISQLGSSFLRKQIGQRNCFTLPIPFQYSICNQDSEEMDRNSTFASKIGKFIAFEINKQLEDSGIAEKCNEWTYKELLVFRKTRLSGSVDVYEVEGAFEPNARFTTIIGHLPDGSLRMGTPDRADMYRKRGICVLVPYWPICDCIK